MTRDQVPGIPEIPDIRSTLRRRLGTFTLILTLTVTLTLIGAVCSLVWGKVVDDIHVPIVFALGSIPIGCVSGMGPGLGSA